jgi:hypothetical protein
MANATRNWRYRPHHEFWGGVFNACASVVALEEGIDTYDKIISSFEEVLSQMCGE